MINLFAVCKNDFFVKALARLLDGHDVQLVGTCNHPGRGFIEYLTFRPRPDIILLDANWNGHNTSIIDLMREFTTILEPPPKIILMTNFCEEKLITKLKPHGASGYFYRAAVHPDTIFHCIRKVHSGELCFQECRTDMAL